MHNHKKSDHTSWNWPNRETLLTVPSILSNIFAEKIYFISGSLGFKFFGIAFDAQDIFRPISIVNALFEKNYYKVAFDLFAYSLSFFGPYGRTASVVVDLCAEIRNYNESCYVEEEDETFSSSTRLDPKIQENAMTILDIPKDKITDHEFINLTYNRMIKELEDKKSKAKGAGFDFLNLLKADIEIAYNTLTAASH